MYALEKKETVGLNQCHICGAEQREHDRFCRRCGVSQNLNTALLTGVIGATGRSDSEKGALPNIKRYGSFSGALVNIVTESVSARTSSAGANRWMASLVSALVALPLWLLIVLLSPLDAYIAARGIAMRV